jgi:hypothetical protein
MLHLITDMKNHIVTAVILLFISFEIQAQSTEHEILKEFYKADANISIVLNYIPKNWVFTADSNHFTITCTDTVWVLDENRINAPFEKKEDQIARIKNNGKRIVPEIVLQYVNKWTPDQIQQANIHNAIYDDEIHKLPKKLNIECLRDKKLSGKNATIYTPTNEQEKKRIEQYEIELTRLQDKKIRLPDFHSEKYSLFIESVYGRADDYHLVYPGENSLELYTILNTFREVCGK